MFLNSIKQSRNLAIGLLRQIGQHRYGLELSCQILAHHLSSPSHRHVLQACDSLNPSSVESRAPLNKGLEPFADPVSTSNLHDVQVCPFSSRTGQTTFSD